MISHSYNGQLKYQDPCAGVGEQMKAWTDWEDVYCAQKMEEVGGSSFVRVSAA